jgi:hypothetical protein
VLSGPALLARRPLAGREVLAGLDVNAGSGVPGASALSHPDSGRPQYASQLAAARQVGPVAGAEREVFRLTGQAARAVLHRCLRRSGEAVVGIRPFGCLAGIRSRPGDPLSQQREQVPAALPHGRERHGIPGQVQRDLERAPGPVPAGDGRHGQHGAIYAT